MNLGDILAHAARGAGTGFRAYLALDEEQDRRARQDRDEMREDERLVREREREERNAVLDALRGGFRPAEAGMREATVAGTARSVAGGALDPTSAASAVASALTDRQSRQPHVEAGGRLLQYQPDVVAREGRDAALADQRALDALKLTEEERERGRRTAYYEPHVQSGAITDLQRDMVVDGAPPSLLDDPLLTVLRGEQARATRATPSGSASGRTGGTSVATQLAALKALQTRYTRDLAATQNRRGRVISGKEQENADLKQKLANVEREIARIGQAGEASATSDPELDELMAKYELEP